MAEQSQPAAAAVAAEPEPAKVSPRFKITMPNNGYNGIHPLGIQFHAGVATTDNQKIATEAAALDWEVIDLQELADKAAAKAAKAKK